MIVKLINGISFVLCTVYRYRTVLCLDTQIDSFALKISFSCGRPEMLLATAFSIWKFEINQQIIISEQISHKLPAAQPHTRIITSISYENSASFSCGWTHSKHRHTHRYRKHQWIFASRIVDVVLTPALVLLSNENVYIIVRHLNWDEWASLYLCRAACTAIQHSRVCECVCVAGIVNPTTYHANRKYFFVRFADTTILALRVAHVVCIR